MQKGLDQHVEALERKVSALWSLARLLVRWIQEPEKGQESLRTMFDRKEHKELLQGWPEGYEQIIRDWKQEF